MIMNGDLNEHLESIAGRNSWTVQKWARMLTSIVRLTCSSVSSNNGFPITTPALFTNTSTVAEVP